jgi:hypothetical protein
LLPAHPAEIAMASMRSTAVEAAKCLVRSMGTTNDSSSLSCDGKTATPASGAGVMHPRREDVCFAPSCSPPSLEGRRTFRTGRFPGSGSSPPAPSRPPFQVGCGSAREQWLAAGGSPLQWRDRSGFSPDSLLTPIGSTRTAYAVVVRIVSSRNLPYKRPLLTAGPRAVGRAQWRGLIRRRLSQATRSRILTLYVELLRCLIDKQRPIEVGLLPASRYKGV